MEILDDTFQIPNKYKFNLFSKLVLISLFILGLYNLFNIYQELNEVRHWVESVAASGGFLCGTGILLKATGYKTFVFMSYLLGVIISLVVFGKNNWKFSQSDSENAILFSPFILFCLNLFFPISLY